MASVGPLIFHGLCCLFLLLGLYDVLFNYEENRCEMSYMWELPKYKQIDLPKNVTDRYPRYGLHLYGEGHYYDVVSNLQLSGIPVLFIPGNGGSKNQARSVASFLLRKAENIKWTTHFNVFTIDLNEELVAFYGATLGDQAAFVHECIRTVFKLYQESSLDGVKPKSLILIGHSMGGMIAKGVFTEPGFDPSLVNTIITFATPHIHPVIRLDQHISSFYDEVNKFWKENCESLKDVTIVSLEGGDRDFQVDGAVARLPSSTENTISTSFSAVPRAWVSADHQCAVWCKQLVLATTRSFFDMVDPATNQISDDANVRMDALRYHFTQNPHNSSSMPKAKKTKLKAVASYSFISVEAPRWSFDSNRDIQESTYFSFNLKEMEVMGKTLLVARTSLSKERWIFACLDMNCSSLIDLSAQGHLTPKYKVLRLELSELLLSDYCRILISVPRLARKLEDFDVNFLNEEEFSFNFTVPHIFSNLWTLNRGYDYNQTLGELPSQFYHKLTLTGLHSIFHAYKFAIAPLHESDTAVLSLPLLELELPEMPAFTYGLDGEKTVKLGGTAGTKVPVLHVYTDGATEHRVRVKVQFVELLGQIVRFQGVSLPTMIMLNAMLTYSYQMKLMLSGKGCLSPADAHDISAKPYKIQPFVNLIKAFYSYEVFSAYWNMFGLPVPDAVLIDNEYRIWFALMPLVIFVFAFEIFSILLYLQKKSVTIFARIFCLLSIPGNKNASLRSIALHTVILGTLTSISSGFAFVYICLLSFSDLCQLSSQLNSNKNQKEKQKNEEKTTVTSEKHDDGPESSEAATAGTMVSSPTEANFHLRFTMHQMWLFLTVLSLPTIIAQLKGYSSPATDPMLGFAIWASVLYLLHKQQSTPQKTSFVSRTICRLLYPVTILTSIFCLHSLHRITYFVLSFISLLVAMQVFG